MLNLKVKEMAKRKKKYSIEDIPNKKMLENDKGIIVVKRKIEFKRGLEKSPCDNCGNMHSSKTFYETMNGKIVGLGIFCNRKVHNEEATNPKFRKDEILNPKNQEK